jgi:phosphoglycerol transferase MdoB-like AlkP superfamily enzyme
MTQEKTQKKPFSRPFIIYLIVLVVILAVGYLAGSYFKPANQSAPTFNLTILTAGFIILTGILLLFRFLNRAPTVPQRKVITTIQCAKCAFKNIRDFQQGDYIPKTVGTGPSCGGPFIIDAIYTEPLQQK